MLLDHCYAFGLSLKPSGLKKKFLEGGDPKTYFCPALDPTLGGSGRTPPPLVRNQKYVIPTKFYQNPSIRSGEEVEKVKSLRRTDGGRRTKCAMTITHSSLSSGELKREQKQHDIKRKRKRADSVIWQKPPHQQKCQKGKVTTQTTPQKSSLRTDLGRSVGVTTATQLVWLTGLRAHLPTNRNSRLIKRTHV